MRHVKKIFGVVVVLVVIGAVVLILLPSPITPQSFRAPEKPVLEGVLAPNLALQSADVVMHHSIYGPEDVAVDAEGNIWFGTQDGKIFYFHPKKVQAPVEVVNTGGRPLGLDFAQDGRLIVADAYKGLLAISSQGEIEVLTTQAEGVPFRFTNDLDIASDGKIYFSDASDTYFQKQYFYDLMEARGHGRLMVYDPATKETKVLMRDLHFANGVALSKQEDFVLVNETGRYRIRRYWLKGEYAGAMDVFMDNLPGIPDGISSNGRGVFWLALFTTRNDAADFMHRFPFLKAQLMKLPKTFWPKPRDYGFVLGIDEQGRVETSLHDPTGRVIRQVTSVEEYDGVLYLGTLSDRRLSWLRVRGKPVLTAGL